MGTRRWEKQVGVRKQGKSACKSDGLEYCEVKRAKMPWVKMCQGESRKGGLEIHFGRFVVVRAKGSIWTICGAKSERNGL